MMPSLRSAAVSAGLCLAAVLGACNRAPPTPGMARGEALFDTCVPCHGAEGHGNRELGAPNIGGLPQWYVEAQLRKFQLGHRGANPFDTVGLRMKSMSLALDLEGDLESVAQYVASMARTRSAPVLTGDARAGQTSYQVCVACHGPSGQGIEAVNSPPLAGQSDWYLLAQLEKFKKGWRGTNPEDISGATMRPNAMILDETAMANVIAYIQTLQ